MSHPESHYAEQAPTTEPACPECADTGRAEMYPGSRDDGNHYCYCDACGRIDQGGQSLDGVMLR